MNGPTDQLLVAFHSARIEYMKGPTPNFSHPKGVLGCPNCGNNKNFQYSETGILSFSGVGVQDDGTVIVRAPFEVEAGSDPGEFYCDDCGACFQADESVEMDFD